MSDWEYKDRPDAFCNVPIDVAAERIGQLFETYRPDVVVTYDDIGPYNHPDHLKATQVTVAAMERYPIPKKLYFTALSRRNWEKVRKVLEEQGSDAPLPEWSPEMIERFDQVEARITTSVTLGDFTEQKRSALSAHASQLEDSFFTRFPPEVFDLAFGQENFIRVSDTTGAALPETDLFAGLR
jgi:LmbE family N-acetylglucosaminyl deacetylase